LTTNGNVEVEKTCERKRTPNQRKEGKVYTTIFTHKITVTENGTKYRENKRKRRTERGARKGKRQSRPWCQRVGPKFANEVWGEKKNRMRKGREKG